MLASIMRPQSFKNYCPECGEEIALTRTDSGNFRCPVCRCEYKRNWRAWILVGVPAIAWGVFLIGSLPGMRLWEAPLGAVYLGGVVLFALFWVWGHKEYHIVEHGSEFADSSNGSKVR